MICMICKSAGNMLAGGHALMGPVVSGGAAMCAKAATLCNGREGSMNRENCPVEQLLHRDPSGVQGALSRSTGGWHWEDEKKWPAL